MLTGSDIGCQMADVAALMRLIIKRVDCDSRIRLPIFLLGLRAVLLVQRPDNASQSLTKDQMPAKRL